MDLVQICIGLYSYSKYMPEEIQPLCNKEDLSEVFAFFVQNNFGCDFGNIFFKATDE